MFHVTQEQFIYTKSSLLRYLLILIDSKHSIKENDKKMIDILLTATIIVDGCLRSKQFLLEVLAFNILVKRIQRISQ